jgi:hypothetical protein
VFKKPFNNFPDLIDENYQLDEKLELKEIGKDFWHFIYSKFIVPRREKEHRLIGVNI